MTRPRVTASWSRGAIDVAGSRTRAVELEKSDRRNVDVDAARPAESAEVATQPRKEIAVNRGGIEGPPGPQGPPGIQGPVGESSRWWTGNGPPNVPAKQWDLYLDLDTGDVWEFDTGTWSMTTEPLRGGPVTPLIPGGG